MHFDLNPLLQGLLGVVFGAIAAAVGALTKWLIGRTTSTVAGSAIAAAGELVQSIVAHVEVHIRPEIQAAFSDGKLTPEEKLRLKSRALELVKQALAENGMERLQKALGLSNVSGVYVYLSGLIERALGVQRAAGTLPPPAPAKVGISALAPTPPLGTQMSDSGRTGEWSPPAVPPVPSTPR